MLDPVGGGITIPFKRTKLGVESTPGSHVLQFCKWDKMNARLQLEEIARNVKRQHKAQPDNVKSMLLLTNTERGVNIFRIQNYESSMLNQALGSDVPLGGMAGSGVFVFDQDRPQDYGIL